MNVLSEPSRALGRALLRAWGRTCVAPGLYYQAVERFGPRLAGATPLPTRLPRGLRMFCDPRDHVQRQIYFHGTYEPIEARLFARLAQPGDVVIDGGANVGQYTLLAARAVGPTGHVHAFEPVPSNFAKLAEHVQANRLTNVTLNPCALWHEDTELDLGLPDDAGDNAGCYRIGAGQAAHVRAVRLDSYAQQVGLAKVNLVKFDIEGAEVSALLGGERLFAANRPTVLLEVNPDALATQGRTARELGALAARLGYRACRVGGGPSERGLVADLGTLRQGNVLLYAGELPLAAGDTAGTFKESLRWARGGW